MRYLREISIWNGYLITLKNCKFLKMCSGRCAYIKCPYFQEIYAEVLRDEMHAVCEFLSNGQQKHIKMYVSIQTEQICKNVNNC